MVVMQPSASIKMKIAIFIILGLFSTQFVWSSSDTLNYYVLNSVDTNFVENSVEIFKCDYLISTEKSHNKCRILINETFYSGKIYYHLIRTDSCLEVFEGEIKNGLIQNGTILRYSKTSQLILSGQFYDNWKYGIWTTYYIIGKIESVMKYIKYSDYPVVEWEYDQTGHLLYYNNEQKEIEKK
jgi:hypothetical protein